MSRHRYRTTLPDGTPVTVTAGRDFPLQWFYCNIEGPGDDPRLEEEDEGFFYSNLHDPEAPHDDGSYVEARLAEHGVAIPPPMARAILADRAEPIRNAVTDGST